MKEANKALNNMDPRTKNVFFHKKTVYQVYKN